MVGLAGSLTKNLSGDLREPVAGECPGPEAFDFSESKACDLLENIK